AVALLRARHPRRLAPVAARPAPVLLARGAVARGGGAGALGVAARIRARGWRGGRLVGGRLIRRGRLVGLGRLLLGSARGARGRRRRRRTRRRHGRGGGGRRGRRRRAVAAVVLGQRVDL